MQQPYITHEDSTHVYWSDGISVKKPTPKPASPPPAVVDRKLEKLASDGALPTAPITYTPYTPTTPSITPDIPRTPLFPDSTTRTPSTNDPVSVTPQQGSGADLAQRALDEAQDLLNRAGVALSDGTLEALRQAATALSEAEDAVSAGAKELLDGVRDEIAEAETALSGVASDALDDLAQAKLELEGAFGDITALSTSVTGALSGLPSTLLGAIRDEWLASLATLKRWK